MRRFSHLRYFLSPRARWAGTAIIVAGAVWWSAGAVDGRGQQPASRSSDGIWQVVNERPADVAARDNIVGQFAVVNFNKAQFDAQLAVVARDTNPAAAGVVMTLPMPDGTFSRFVVKESPILAPELQRDFPEIKTYSGQGLDDPTATIRFGWTQLGFHSILLSGQTPTIYIDPYERGNTGTYVVYNKMDYRSPGESWACLVAGEHSDALHRAENAFPISHGDTLRTYRLALAATGEYTATAGGTKAGALAQMTTTMNRVNGIYERDLSVRMTVATGSAVDSTALIYTDGSTDPYTNNDGGLMLSENQTNIDTVVGTANYDIGHVFSTGGGGVAYLTSPCNASLKAGGVTGSPTPTGDAFDVDYVAHEMGHQFGGNHTFNGNAGNCTTRSASHAYEVGSGVTIQAYAGICNAENLQPNSIDRFHVESLDEMTAFLTSGGGSTCGTTSATGNTPPTVSAGSDYTIPAQTPFRLTATGSDANSDTLSYAWDQFDLGTVSTNVTSASTDDGTRPLFRPYAVTSDPSRTFPSATYLLNNANTPPTTYSCAIGTCLTGETLPTTSRTMNFQVTVRDNRSGGGGIATDLMTVTTVATAGPFRITSQNTATSGTGNTAITVTWDVAGTTAAPISATNVTIRFSADGGTTFPYELAASTANDGSESVILPNVTTSTGRILVQGVNNIFFDLNDANVSVTAGAATVPGTPNAPAGTGGDGTVALSWSAPANNGGSAITGYQVQVATSAGGTYADAAGCTANTTSTATSCTASGLTNGTPYFFKVAAINSVGTGAFSAASAGITPAIPSGTLSVSPSTLLFAATKNGAAGAITSVTGAQTVSLAFSSGTGSWTVSADQPWVALSATSGSGTGSFTVSISDAGNAIGGSTSLSASVTITAPAASNSPRTVTVSLSVDQSNGAATTVPFGSFDTPANNATGLTGAIAVTGWALDDIGVDRVEIWRNCVAPVDTDRPGVCRNATPGGAADSVYIGNANFLPGARTDVEGLNPTVPQAYRAGWGYLLLTNALPNLTTNATEGGQGTFTLSAYAVDAESRYTLLGTRTVTLDNDNATQPFGAIDTPEQGGTVTAVVTQNFGWAMTRRQNALGVDVPKCIERTRYRVFVDGVARTLTTGGGGNFVTGLVRSDLTAAYPGLCDSADSLAAYYLNTGTLALANGLHTIGWDVYDDNGTTGTQADDNVAGIGSRFFNILVTGDRAGRQVADPFTARPASRGLASSVARLPVAEGRAVWARVGALEQPGVSVTADATGTRRINLPTGRRVAVNLGGPVSRGYLIVGDELRDLPIGSTLDGPGGYFYWEPATPFFGPFPMVFLAEAAGQSTRTNVVVTITDGTAGGDPVVRITSPESGANPNPVVTVAGTAVDPQAVTGSGISTVHVWARRIDTVDAATPFFLGAATMDGAGYALVTAPMEAGTYEYQVFAWVDRLGTWAPAATVTHAVR